MKVGAIYLRVSSDEQTKNNSLPTQLQNALALAQREGIHVPEEHIFTDDESAYQLGSYRPGWERAKHLADRGAYQVLIVNKSDRLTREGGVANQHAIQWFQARGITILSATDIISYDPVAGEIVNVAVGWANRQYVRSMVEQMQRGKRLGAANGRPPTGRAPYPYRYVKETGRVELDPTWARVTKEVYNWIVEEGLSAQAYGRG